MLCRLPTEKSKTINNVRIRLEKAWNYHFGATGVEISQVLRSGKRCPLEGNTVDLNGLRVESVGRVEWNPFNVALKIEQPNVQRYGRERPPQCGKKNEKLIRKNHYTDGVVIEMPLDNIGTIVDVELFVSFGVSAGRGAVEFRLHRVTSVTRAIEARHP